MDFIARVFGKLRRRSRRGEAGFTLIEVVIASTLMFGALTSLAYIGTVALTDVGVGRVRQTATGLGNQAIEQVRSLSYDIVAKGMNDADIASSGDTAITTSGSDYIFRGERMPHGQSSTAVVPLNPHVQAKTLDDIAYTVKNYVTYFNDDLTTNAFRVTSVVTWTGGLRPGLSKSVEVQTVVYAGSGCPTSVHPLPGPCQAYFWSNSTMAPGGVIISPGSTGTAFPGVSFDSVTMSLPEQGSSLAIEATSRSEAHATTSGTRYRVGGVDHDVDSVGPQILRASADDDPGGGAGEYQYVCVGVSPCTVATVGSAMYSGLTAGGNGLALTSSGGDTAKARAAMKPTSSTNLCPNAASTEVNQNDSLPCANGWTNQAGTLLATVAVSGRGTATLVSVGPSSTSAAFSKRVTTPSGSGGCASVTTNSDGCVSAVHRQTIGTVCLGGLPSGLLSGIPAGFTCLLKWTGASTTVAAEAGVGNANPSVTRTGTLSYWNGVGYTAVALAGNTGQSIPVVPVSFNDALTNTTVYIGPDTGQVVRVGSTSAATCASPCYAAEAKADSPITGDFTYKVVAAGVTVVDLHLHIDFGSLIATASYKPK